MGAECGFQTKQQLNECILRCPWSEFPLPPVHRACRDGDLLSLTYLTVQGDKLAVFRSINAQDQFLMWTPAHWAAYFGKVGITSEFLLLENYLTRFCLNAKVSWFSAFSFFFSLKILT